MSTFTDLVKSRRESGLGIGRSLGESFREFVKEKFDTRRFLNQSGLLVALFPQLKAYEAKKAKSKSKIEPLPTKDSLNTSLLENIKEDTALFAKNSLVLPSMARDVFVMKENIAKLVKLKGKKPATSAKEWMSRQAARETAYESRFVKKPIEEKVVSSKPKTSFLSKMLGVAGLGLGMAMFSGNASAGVNWSGAFGGSMGGGEGRADPGSEREAMDFFMSRGWTKEQSAGIVGNLIAESNLKTNIKGDGGKAYGIAQWHPDRQERFRRVYGKDIRESSFKEQLAFVDWELNNDERRAGNLLRMSTDAGHAAAIVDQYYERSAGFHRQKRINTANRLSGGQISTAQSQPTQPAVSPSPTPATTPNVSSSVPKVSSPDLQPSTKQMSKTNEIVAVSPEVVAMAEIPIRDKDIIVQTNNVVEPPVNRGGGGSGDSRNTNLAFDFVIDRAVA